MFGRREKGFKAQSAMEYLMTYGWAILIIAVVLAALFALGVFSGASLLGTSCVASSGYTCTNPVMNTAGILTINFGQSTGVTLYDLNFACAATSNSTGLPFLGTSLTYNSATTSNGLPVQYSFIAPVATSGQTFTGVSTECYSTTGSAVGNGGPVPSTAAPLGTAFSGSLYLAYNATSPNGKPNQFSKFATITIKVT
ncbi:MAG: hypothetical protein QXN59_00845 [Candidatus Micrarchaeaceae archaeon]